MGVLYLFGAILSEVFGSSMLKLTAMIKSRLPIFGIVAGYLVAFYLLSLSLRTIPLSFGYAVWSGVGTALTAVVGFVFFREKFQRTTVFGIVLLIIGIMLMQI